MQNDNKTYLRRVHYYETDQMSIVHHANYIRWFEEARLDLMDRSGMPYREMEEDGIWMPVTYVDCQYLLSLRFGDTAEIVTSLVFFNGVRAVFQYEIYTKNEWQLAVKGESGHCFLDAVSRRPLNLQKRRPDLCTKIESMIVEERENNKTGKRRML